MSQERRPATADKMNHPKPTSNQAHTLVLTMQTFGSLGVTLSE
jgi:hypothetical protein